MNHLSKLLGLLLASAVVYAGSGAAATLSVGAKTLSAGNTPVSSCAVLSSLTASRTVDNAGHVTGVTVPSIPVACAGETMSVALVGAGNIALGAGTGVVGSCGATTCSVSITASGTDFGTSVSAASVTSFSFAVVGA